MKKILLTVALVIGAWVQTAAWGVEPFVVKDIRVEGLQRVESGTIFATIPLRAGDKFDDAKGTAIIRSLFALGLFKDVRLETKDDILIVAVQERPTIADISFVGMKEFDKDNMLKALKEAGLTEGRPYDKSLSDKAEQELKRSYISKSLYGTEIATTVTPIENNRVNIAFNVTESEVAKIKNIRIVGAKAFSESTLRAQMDLDTTGGMSWYTKSDRYSRTKFNADLETIRSYYFQRGYVEFKVDSTQVALSADKERVDITINITEGQRYVVSSIDLKGNFLGKDDEFKSLIKVVAGDSFNAETMNQTVKAMTDLYGKFGFAFGRVNPEMDIDRVKAQVKIVFAGDPSRRAFVRRINISGNARTKDEVIRREFRQFEASWYDGDKIKLSRDRIDRLGFFEEVLIDTQEVPGNQDQVDLNLTVKEKRSGNILLGAGYSSAEKITLQFTVSESNAFGSGQSLALNINTSKFNQIYSLSTTNPYFTDSGVSRTWSVYQRKTRPYYATLNGDYQVTTTGGGLSFGIPVTEYDRVFVGINAEQIAIETGTSIPASYLAYANQFGYTSRAYPLSLGWSKDDRDSYLNPSRGRYMRLGSNLSKTGDAHYMTNSGQYQHYVPINKQYTFAFNSEFGVGKGLDGRPYPVFKNFYSGGLGSVRGYQQNSLGPRDVSGAWIGGAKKVTLNAEVTAPFPGAGNDRSLRLGMFYDMGNVFADTESIEFTKMRSSVGLGLSWVSAIGPLRFTYATPVKAMAGDTIQKFQFQIGTAF